MLKATKIIASTAVARVRKSAAPRADMKPDGLPPTLAEVEKESERLVKKAIRGAVITKVLVEGADAIEDGATFTFGVPNPKPTHVRFYSTGPFLVQKLINSEPINDFTAADGVRHQVWRIGIGACVSEDMLPTVIDPPEAALNLRLNCPETP